MESRLHNVGILTYAQLAALSPEELVERLGLSGMAAKNVSKHDWAGQARQFATSPEATPAEPAPALPLQTLGAEDASSGRQHYATFTVELLLGEESEVRRTRVKHIQEGEQETWAGWEDGRLVSFFVEHAALRGPATAGASALAGGAEQLAELDIEVTGLEVDEAEEMDGSRLRAQIEFQLSGIAAKQVASERAAYFIHILAYMIATGETIVLTAVQGELQPGTLLYMKSVDFAPPQVGHYQLLATVVLSEYTTVGAAVGPKLRVVP
jgi:hypothetical protein